MDELSSVRFVDYPAAGAHLRSEPALAVGFLFRILRLERRLAWRPLLALLSGRRCAFSDYVTIDELLAGRSVVGLSDRMRLNGHHFVVHFGEEIVVAAAVLL